MHACEYELEIARVERDDQRAPLLRYYISEVRAVLNGQRRISNIVEYLSAYQCFGEPLSDNRSRSEGVYSKRGSYPIFSSCVNVKIKTYSEFSSESPMLRAKTKSYRNNNNLYTKRHHNSSPWPHHHPSRRCVPNLHAQTAHAIARLEDVPPLCLWPP